MVAQAAGSIADVAGIMVGHAQNFEGLTGCTVILCESPAMVGVDVRGSAPATLETDLCRPGTLVEHANAILLTGGSAFGLAAAGGVMRFLHENHAGYPTPTMPVPIVPAAAIYDLGLGDAIWPNAEMAYEACRTAGKEPAQGSLGAGTGATVGKLLGHHQAMKAGLGMASVKAGEATLGALIVVNALGAVVRPESGRLVAGPRHPQTNRPVDALRALQNRRDLVGEAATNTTIGVIATDAQLSSAQVNHLASIGHDGIARAIFPAHTEHDGDTLFALATGSVPYSGPLVELEVAVVLAVERAIVRAVEEATGAGGLPAFRDL